MTDPRPGPPYSAFFGRLRARPLSSWAVGERIAVAREVAAALAALGWYAEGHDQLPVPAVPDLGPHVLADQVQVLTASALAAGVEPAAVHAIIAMLAERLSVRLD
jgi:hypothetical protein